MQSLLHTDEESLEDDVPRMRQISREEAARLSEEVKAHEIKNPFTQKKLQENLHRNVRRWMDNSVSRMIDLVIADLRHNPSKWKFNLYNSGWSIKRMTGIELFRIDVDFPITSLFFQEEIIRLGLINMIRLRYAVGRWRRGFSANLTRDMNNARAEEATHALLLTGEIPMQQT